MYAQPSKARARKQVDVDKDDDDLKRAREGYAWESSNVRSWDQIEEDPETGKLKSFVRDEQIARKRTRDDGFTGVRRGIIRFCVLVIDMSEYVCATDLKPSRADLICETVGAFAKEFFDQNPISQLSVVITRDYEALKLSPFSSNQKHHIEAVQKALRLGPSGAASLQNALKVANKNLAAVPPYAMKEILVCYGSLSTCDPGDIHATIDTLVSSKVRCSAVGLGAELHILRVLTKKTTGTYSVAVNEEHFRESLGNHVIPPPTTTKQVSASLIRMGYPMLQRIQHAKQYTNNPSVRGQLGYRCPRCAGWLSEMPCECTLCGLTLVSSPHLARSYHHLFPVPKFISLENSDLEMRLQSKEDEAKFEKAMKLVPTQVIRCTGCTKLLEKESSLRLLCPSCVNVFCVECDTFVHDSLHHCPGCGVKNLIL